MPDPLCPECGNPVSTHGMYRTGLCPVVRFSPPPDPLARVRQAARNAESAASEYRAALTAAHTAGVSYADIARAAGVTRQAARQLIGRNT